MAVLAMATCAFAQSTNRQETTYRRSSLYTIMIPDADLTGDEKTIVSNTFLEKAFPDKYDNMCMKTRVIELKDLESLGVTQADIDKVDKELTEKKSGAGKLLKKGISFIKKASADEGTEVQTASKDAQYIAQLNAYFAKNHIAGKLVAKWLGGGETAVKHQAPRTTLIEQRGLNTLSQDELNKAKQMVGGKEKLVGAAMYDLMGKTFVMVNRYSYTPAEDIIAYISAAASSVAGDYAALAGAGLAAVIKGYFVKTTTYLYQLDITKDDINKFAEMSDISSLYTDDNIKLKYVGKTWDYAPATLQLSTKSDADTKLIARATVRATDGAIAKLQKKYDQFKTLSTLHQDGEKLYAYVGTKEGCKEGDKFEVLQKKLDENGNEVYDVIGKVKIEKGQLWDNREGAGEKIEGAATDKEDKSANANLSYSGMGTSKKLLDGSLIRQVK